MKIKLTSEEQFQGMARVESERESQVIDLYSFASSGIALLEAEGKPWAKGGRDAAKAYLEAAGVSYDNCKRVLSRTASMLKPEHRGFVPGLKEAALKGAPSALAALRAAGVKSQYDVIQRTSDPDANKGGNDPANRLAGILVTLANDKKLRKLLPRALATAEGKSPGITATVADILDGITSGKARTLVATNAAPKAQAKRKSHVGKPLVLGGGSANAAKPHKAIKGTSNGEAHTA